MRLAMLVALSALLTQQPQFRGGVELVTVDVRVVAADGTVLPGLAREDFELKVECEVRSGWTDKRLCMRAAPGWAQAS
jgi:hypothetical protein